MSFISPLPTIAQPRVVITVGAVSVIPAGYAWITFINVGAAPGTIDWGSGNITPLAVNESITMPYVNRPYVETTVSAAATTIKTVYVV